MRKTLILLTLLLGGLAVFSLSCELENIESCEQELFCDGTKEVTACCVMGGDCVYTYNGVDYPDTEQGMADLLVALDCANAKSDCYEEELFFLEEQLKALMARAHDGLQKNKK